MQAHDLPLDSDRPARPSLATLTATFLTALVLGASLSYFGVKDIVTSERTRPNFFVLPAHSDTLATDALPRPRMNVGPSNSPNAGPSNVPPQNGAAPGVLGAPEAPVSTIDR